jgi:predicted Ser/Thr protein kinase
VSETPIESIGPYKPERLISTGGQAQVWLAHGPSGVVALKVARTDTQREGLLREVKALRAAGAHPHVVKLVGHSPDGAWASFEHVAGATAEVWAEDHDLHEIAEMGARLLAAIRHLHASGVVHGDVKPGNVLVGDDGIPKLIDLGVAAIANDAAKGFRGTPGYAAPEMLRGERPTAASDVYGFGGVLYTCLTGRMPFQAPDSAALAYLPMVSLPEPPPVFRPDVPAALSQLVLTLLARDPTRRPTDLDRIADQLRKAAESPVGHPIMGMRREREDIRRAVVGAADSECRVVVLYGPPGSGRRTLLNEAVEAARREGVTFLKETDPTELVASVKKLGKKPYVAALRASQPGVVPLAKAMLDQHLPGLLLLHADRPVPGMGKALQITPPPLSQEDTTVLVRILGGPASQGEAWWRDTFGHPLSIVGKLRGWRRSTGGPRTAIDTVLPALSRRVLQAIRKGGEMKLPELAAASGMTEHDLLDHCEVLFAEELIVPTQDGAAIAVTEAGKRPVTEAD